MEYAASASVAAAGSNNKHHTSFVEESDLRRKLAEAASLLAQKESDSNKNPRAPVTHQSPSQTYGFSQSGADSRQNHPQLRVNNSASATDIMPSGISSSSEHSGASSSNAMAVHGLLDHDPSDPNELDDSTTDGRKAKRELSQSKRAAQNRAAQRAFRQRKEHYIKKLEQQVRDYGDMEHAYKIMQNENYGLREYVLQLQSRLLDLQVEPPQPPPNLNISSPAAPVSSRAAPRVPEPPASTSSAGSLADVAAAVADFRAREPSAEGPYSTKPSFKVDGADTRNDDEIRRQLQREPLPPSSSLRA